MWRIAGVDTRNVRLDFRSSGQSSRDVTQLIADGVVFANAVELTDWSVTTGSQMLVCEGCGIEHCQSGGWLYARAAGEYVVFLPTFDEMRQSDLAEYGPPEYVSTIGIPLLDSATYSAIRRHVPGLPKHEELALMTGRDVLDAIQWEAPRQALGRFPATPEIRRSNVLAVSDGDIDEVFSALVDLFAQVRDMESIALRPVLESEREITVYLEGHGTPTWTPMVTSPDRDRYVLRPTEGFAVEGRRGDRG